MKNINRFFLKKYDLATREKLMLDVAHFIRTEVSPLRLIFFGSVTTDRFDDFSDIDVIAIFKNTLEATHAMHKIYQCLRPDFGGHSVEILCTDEETFNTKSKVGGVYAVALKEGIEFT